MFVRYNFLLNVSKYNVNLNMHKLGQQISLFIRQLIYKQLLIILTDLLYSYCTQNTIPKLYFHGKIQNVHGKYSVVLLK